MTGKTIIRILSCVGAWAILSVAGPTSIDKEIEKIMSAPPQKRVELMNAFKKRLFEMNQQERALAIQRLRGSMQPPVTGATAPQGSMAGAARPGNPAAAGQRPQDGHASQGTATMPPPSTAEGARPGSQGGATGAGQGAGRAPGMGGGAGRGGHR